MLISKSIFFRTTCIFCIGLVFLTGLAQSVGSAADMTVCEQSAGMTPTPLSQEESYVLSARSEGNLYLKELQTGDTNNDPWFMMLAVIGALVLIGALIAAGQDNSEEDTN